jgi:hypothetical protein
LGSSSCFVAATALLHYNGRFFTRLPCLLQEQETLGIVPIFWKDEEEADRAAILPLTRLQGK